MIGRLGKPNGLKGYMGLYVDDTELEMFSVGSVVLINSEPHEVRGIRRGKKGHEVAFQGVLDREGAESLRGESVYATRRRELASNEFWPDQLRGLEVRPGGGRVVAIEYGPAQDRLVVEREGTRFEVPFVDELVPKVDLEAGFVEIVEIDGLTQR